MDGSAPATRRPEDGIGYLDGPPGERRRGGAAAILGLAWTVLYPWLGPATYWFTLGRVRSDFWELSGVLLWPALFCLIGMYLATLDRKRVRRTVPEGPRTRKALATHGRLSAASLLALAIFEGGMVVAMSIWRWNRHERDIAVGIFEFCLVVYAVHVALALLARRALRRAEHAEA